MKLDQPWCTHLHYQIDNQLLILCKQEVTTPKRHTDIIRDKRGLHGIYTRMCLSVCVCMCLCVYVYVSTDVYVRVSDSMASNNNNYPIN